MIPDHASCRPIMASKCRLEDLSSMILILTSTCLFVLESTIWRQIDINQQKLLFLSSVPSNYNSSIIPSVHLFSPSLLSISTISTSCVPTLPRPRPFSHLSLFSFFFFLLPLLLLLMASSMPQFLSRLFRPFSSSARLSLSPDSPSVNSASTSAMEAATTTEKCTVAAGCFWGVEHLFRKQFAGKGLVDARVGYIGGDANSPSYRAVCTGRTGRECSHFSLSLKIPCFFFSFFFVSPSIIFS